MSRRAKGAVNQPIQVTIFYNDDTTKELKTYDAMVGVWDGKTNDDDIFYWFDGGGDLVGDHGDFTVVSVEMPSERKHDVRPK